MTTELEQQLCRIIDAVDFHSPDTFLFAGSPSTLWSGDQVTGTLGSQPVPANTAVQKLQNALYANCYTRVFRGSIQEWRADVLGNPNGWVDALSAANASKDHWEEGWQVQQFLPSGQVNAQKGTTVRTFWPGEFISHSGPGMAPQTGSPISVLFQREARSMQPGFYFAFGETQGAPEDDFPTVRFYWNLKAEAATELTGSLTAALNRYQVPFRFKVVNHPAMIARSDTALLYVGRRFYRIAAEIALEVQARLVNSLEDDVPLFTLRLASGLAFAEDTGTQESFGMARCRLVAEGLFQAHSEGLSKVEDRLERVRRQFAVLGISLDRPYLNSAATLAYEFPK